MFQKKVSDQHLQITSLVQGQMFTIIMSDVTVTPILEFKHATDPNWLVHPDFDGTPDAGVVVQHVRCLTAQMRITHASAPGSDYYVSTIWHSEDTF